MHNGGSSSNTNFFSSYSHPVVRIQPRSWQGSSVHTAAADSVTFTLPAAAFLCPMEDIREPVDIRVTQQCIRGDSLYRVQSAGPCICSLMMLQPHPLWPRFSISLEPQPGAQGDSNPRALDTQVYSISSRLQVPPAALAL